MRDTFRGSPSSKRLAPNVEYFTAPRRRTAESFMARQHLAGIKLDIGNLKSVLSVIMF